MSDQTGAAKAAAAAAVGEPALYNSSIINTYIKMVKVRYPYVSVAALLGQAAMEPYQVEDEGHWFTQSQVDRFYEALVRLTGKTDIAREAGQYAASPEAIGGKSRFILGFIGPALVFEMVDKIADKFTRSARFSSRKLSRTEMEIVVSPNPGVSEQPYQCANRIGYFEAIVRAFHQKMLKVEHPECLFKGGSCCRYRISWSETKALLIKRIRNAFMILSALYFVISITLLPGASFSLAAPLSIVVLLVLTLSGEYLDKRDADAAFDNLRSSNEKLFEQLSLNYDHALMINEIGFSIAKQVRMAEILSGAMDIIRKWLDYDRGMILLADDERQALRFSTGYGYSDELLPAIRGASFNLTRADSKGVFVTCFREQKPFLVNDIAEITASLSPRSLDFARQIGSRSFICCPIVYENTSLGILAVDNIRTKRPLLQSDINLLMGIAPQIAISLRNAMLLRARERQFASILQVLAASIDARDFLTAGHSEKVTEYALGICREMGLSTDFTEMIRVAALLHDYGKIGIKDAILKKQGPLDDLEREDIKTHVVKTRAILERINFEGIYREVPMIAGSHHERMDGMGYPAGLRGAEIPLGARIIAVADFFEAITARRHYREPMAWDAAVETMLQQCGNHLDTQVVLAFLRHLAAQGLWSMEPASVPSRQ
jgi:HD-GYP domain-containing protein (c-di-GMP phosphodiesterase class II)